VYCLEGHWEAWPGALVGTGLMGEFVDDQTRTDEPTPDEHSRPRPDELDAEIAAAVPDEDEDGAEDETGAKRRDRAN
jgi:hypothetical protein